MRIENIVPSRLTAALLDAGRNQGWNFRDIPVRAATIGACRIYVVPAKLWAYPSLRKSAVRSAPVQLKLVAP